MPQHPIPNFVGGLNKFLHPTQIEDNQVQSLENMEVRPVSIGGDLSYMALTARLSYKRLNSDNLDFIPKNLIEFVQRGNSVSAVVFSGSGLDDATSSGTYTGTTIMSTYEIEIDGTGTPDTFKWRKDAGSYTSTVNITGSAQSLDEGVSITFLATTGHTLADLWTITVSPDGTIFLVTGGFNSSNELELRYLADGETASSEISTTSSSDTGSLVLLPYNDELYYTDGSLPWRKWNGTRDAVSGFTTITKTAIQHKNLIVYANDVTNGTPNVIWVSSTGTPETVPAANTFVIGDRSDPIIGLMDQIERILIIKERSTWAFYKAPTLSDSTILRADEWKGSVSPLGQIWGSFGTFVMTTDAGLQKVTGLRYDPTALPIYNFLKGFQNTLAALGFREDQILLATKSVSADTYNKRLFSFDVNSETIFQSNLNISCLCLNRGVLTFGGRLKACEDGGSAATRKVIEFDQVSGNVESTVSCLTRTKEYDCNQPTRVKTLNHLMLDAYYPDTTTLTIKAYVDGSLTETQTYTPSGAGFHRAKIDFINSTSYGYHISFQFEYSQSGTESDRFALLSGIIDFSVESREANTR